MIYEATNILFKLISDIHEDIHTLKEHYSLACNVYQAIQHQITDVPVEVNGQIEWLIKNPTSIAVTTSKNDNPYEAETVGHHLFEFLIRGLNEFTYVSDFMFRLNNIFQIQRIIIGNELSGIDICVAMMNYNFDLGYRINRHKFNLAIGGKNGFVTTYDNKIDYAVTVKLAYYSNLRFKYMKKKKKIPTVTFIVYQDGPVAYVCPGKLTNEIYNLFRRTVLQYENQFRIDHRIPI
jgi:hypothetical protein